MGLRERRGVLRCGNAALRVFLLVPHLQREHLQAARQLDQEVSSTRLDDTNTARALDPPTGRSTRSVPRQPRFFPAAPEEKTRTRSLTDACTHPQPTRFAHSLAPSQNGDQVGAAQGRERGPGQLVQVAEEEGGPAQGRAQAGQLRPAKV